MVTFVFNDVKRRTTTLSAYVLCSDPWVVLGSS